MMGSSGADWAGGAFGQGGQPSPAYGLPEGDDYGMSVRPMGLKVHYTFDNDGRENYLAHGPHPINVHTIPLDDRTSIGVVDLRLCLQTIAQNSPEIVGQLDKDYNVYALDYSEQGTPLVGQGMLSWGLEPSAADSEPKMITGRIITNLLAMFNKGNRETLEVKLKLNAVPKMVRPGMPHDNDRRQSYMNNAPTDVSNEWSNFRQSNPNFGHSAYVGSVSSPMLQPVRPDSQMYPGSQGFPSARLDQGLSPPPAVPTPPLSFGGTIPQPSAQMPMSVALAPSSQGPALGESNMAPKSTETASPKPSKAASRPSSRARGGGSVNKKPRGRPRRTALADGGNTSAIEDPTDVDEDPKTKKSKTTKASAADDPTDVEEEPKKKPEPKKQRAKPTKASTADEPTEVEEGPKKKRAKTTKAQRSDKVKLDSAPDSLRIAASLTGSLRTMRPAGAGVEGGAGANHLQEVPRAPTPIPTMGPQGGRKPTASQARRQSVAESENTSALQTSDTSMFMPQSQDVRSPTESMGQSPFQGYSPGDSVPDIGSSPPVPRTTPFAQQSPMASSPILPPMSMPPPDSGFFSGDFGDMDDVDLVTELPLGDSMPPTMEEPFPKPHPRPRPANRQNVQQQYTSDGADFMQVNPGPPEMLPKTSMFVPHHMTKVLNNKSKGIAKGTGAKAKAKPKRQLKRANTAPSLQQQGPQSEAAAGTPNMPLSPLLESEIGELGSLRQEQPDQGAGTPAAPQLPLLQPEPTPQSEVTLQAPPPQPESLTQPGVIEPSVHGSDHVSTKSPAGVQESVEVDEDPIMLLQLTEPPLDADNDVQMTASEAPMAAPELPLFNTTSRNFSTSATPMPASDPVTRTKSELPPTAFSEAPGPPSEYGPKSKRSKDKNLVMKKAIKEKLDQAVETGAMPLFCHNCGAIETPTWRKWFYQIQFGSPEFPIFSAKPGQITAIDILERDENEKPTKYRLIKKSLGPNENKELWSEVILCNPCGIWLHKYKSHRPQDKWQKDADRIGQSRRKRDRSDDPSGSKKSRTSSGGGINPTSEAYFTTDPIGPADQGSSPVGDDEQARDRTEPPDGATSKPSRSEKAESWPGSPFRQGSTHSRGSGTAQSPIAVDDGLGTTRRLLFPSPRKDGESKVLGEVAVNVVKTSPDHQVSKEVAAGKENVAMAPPATPRVHDTQDDEMQDLFGTPPDCPSTPPSKANPGPFKTPTKPTPSHRPITRSVSKSIQSVRSMVKSPGHALLQLQQTPTRSSSVKRRSTQHELHAHFALDDSGLNMNSYSESPFTSQLNQLLSEANDFTTGSAAHGLGDMDLTNLDSDNFAGQFDGAMDFGNYLSTDMVMPSSPPVRARYGQASFGASLTYDASTDMSIWETFQDALGEPVDDEQHKVEDTN